jgi:hypothetical protein
MDRLARNRRGTALGIAFFFILGSGAILAERLERAPAAHPAKVVLEGLREMGLRAGYANYWVSEPVRFLSRDQTALTPYNKPPFSRSAFSKAHHEAEIAFVVLEGLDLPEQVSAAVGQIQKSGYKLVRRKDFENGWFVLVFDRIGTNS